MRNSSASGLTPVKGFKDVARRALASTMHRTGLLRFSQRLARKYELRIGTASRLPRLGRSSGSKFGILCYHRVGKGGVPFFSQLDPKVFEAQMAYIRSHFRVVSLGQLCRELKDGDSVPPTLAVTFDDGYRDLYAQALPALRQYNVPATVYLVAECLETGVPPWYDAIFAALQNVPGPTFQIELHEPRSFSVSSESERIRAAWEIVCFLRSLPDCRRRKWCEAFRAQVPVPSEGLKDRMLSWEQVREMQEAGVSFGAHTSTHPVVSRLDADSLEVEICRSKDRLQAGLGVPVLDFAYPFGKVEDCGTAAEPFLLMAGYRSAVTTTTGFNRSGADAFRLRRMQIGDDPSLSLFAFELSRMFLESEPEGTAELAQPSRDGLLQAAHRGNWSGHA